MTAGELGTCELGGHLEALALPTPAGGVLPAPFPEAAPGHGLEVLG